MYKLRINDILRLSSPLAWILFRCGREMGSRPACLHIGCSGNWFALPMVQLLSAFQWFDCSHTRVAQLHVMPLAIVWLQAYWAATSEFTLIGRWFRKPISRQLEPNLLGNLKSSTGSYMPANSTKATKVLLKTLFFLLFIYLFIFLLYLLSELIIYYFIIWRLSSIKYFSAVWEWLCLR